MLGKKQKRICCLCCKKDYAVNIFYKHIKTNAAIAAFVPNSVSEEG